ncbi:5295_t:CDS:2 [Racocetra fulgida]|uniref:5295_t:CDS:1 n=1 Tax=Racocetra fulgida TaxID=60492 RepID=A0A9N9FAP3_9GLOM|nr:5295_t:CDS:2 [Racocetra fulgida]
MASTILADIVDPLNPVNVHIPLSLFDISSTHPEASSQCSLKSSLLQDQEEFLSYSQPRFFNSDDSRHSDSMGSGSRKSRRKSSATSLTRLKVDNSFLKNQNIKLLLELEHSRLTIQALKNIVNQKESTLQSYRNENQKAILKIRVLEALIFSKHAKDGSIIVRSSGGGSVNENGLSTNDKKLDIKVDKVDNVDKVLNDDTIHTNLTNLVDNSLQPASYQDKLSIKKSKEKLPKKDSSPKSTKNSSPPPRSNNNSPPQSTKNPQSIQSIKNSSPSPQQSSQSSSIFRPQSILSSILPSQSNDSSKKIKHQRRWSMDFGPRSHLTLSSSPHSSRRLHSVSPTSSSTVYADSTANDPKSRGMPRLIKFKTGDIIQTLASCRPASTKNGYDFSPPSTPIPFDKNELSDGDNNDEESDVDEICENTDGNSIEEKRQRKLGQGLLSKIFSSTSFPSSISMTPAARGSLSR